MMSSIADKLNIYHLSLPENFISSQIKNSFSDLDDISVQNAGLIIYTSGTTGRPKGVVHTQSSLIAQVIANKISKHYIFLYINYYMFILFCHLI